MQTQKMMRDMGYIPDSKGNSAQDKLGTDKEGNDLLADINSLTSDGSQRTGLIEGIKNKFKIKQEAKSKEHDANQFKLAHQKAMNDIKLKEEEKSVMNFANQYPGLLGGSSLIY
jgi:hypothetical protein